MTPYWVLTLELMLDPSWAMLGPCWGYVELCWDHVGSCSVKIGARLAHFGGMLGLWLAERAYVGPCWGYVAIWGLCWGQVRPSRAMLELWLCYFHDVTFPKVCLKKLSPAACVCRRFEWPASFTFRALSLPLVACEPVGGELQPSKGRVAAMLGSFFPKSVLRAQ